MSGIDSQPTWSAATKTLRNLVGHERGCPRYEAWWGSGDVLGDCTCEGRAPLCDRVHLISMEASLLESELTMVIVKALDGGEFDDFTTDYYDNSIEVYGVATDVDLGALAAAIKRMAGFTLVWLHQHPAPRGDCTCRVR